MDEYEYISPSRHICKRNGDPYIYLLVGDEWYCYDPSSITIGSGAMGTVYLGYRISNRARVAIKRVKDAFASNPMIRERAIQEANMAFRHPNLIENLGYCAWNKDSGPFFILSNYVQGESIRSFVKNLPNDASRAARVVDLIMPVVDALDYIHSRGIVHRDVKPSNIMIENGSTTRLMDLGIARMNGGNKFSVAGFIGTPQYSAPEQILRVDPKSSKKSQVKEISGRTDEYALAETVYELITGHNPFDRNNTEEILAMQMRETLPPHALIPPPMMKVLLKGAAKNPEDRYPTIREFGAALKNSLTVQETPSEKALEWCKNNIAIVAAGVVAIIAIVVLLITLI